MPMKWFYWLIILQYQYENAYHDATPDRMMV